LRPGAEPLSVVSNDPTLGRSSMNLVGKIFIVGILVMSLVIMAIAMSVYAARRNWRDEVVKAGGLNDQVRAAQARNKELTDERDKAIQAAAAEKSSQQQAIAKLRTELDIVQKERKALETSQADLEKAKRDAVAAMSATQKNSSDYRAELEKLRTETLQAQQDRDAHFKEVVRLTDELNQAVNEKTQLRKRVEDMAKDLAKANEALRYFDINPNSDYKGKVPPKLEGIVRATLEHGLVEISLGSDQGLRKGHTLEIYRTSGGQSTYVGRVEVVQVNPDRSVCKMDPKFQNSQVMVGDRVASKIE
jgi:uncharacterized protein YhaN